MKRSQQLRKAAKSAAWLYAHNSMVLRDIVSDFSPECQEAIYWALNFAASLPDWDELEFRKAAAAAIDARTETTATKIK